jgi:hypothetical protein
MTTTQTLSGLRLSLATLDRTIAQAQARGTATEALYTERGKLRLQILALTAR